MFSTEELAEITSAKTIINKTKKGQKFGISTDTRLIKQDEIYLPLKGLSFDGENFIDNGNLKMYFTAKDRIDQNAELVLKVENTLGAYLNIAKYYRQKINPITIAITGSSGKTTTKEIMSAVLSQKFKTHKTFSNYNNEIGFCRTVLDMPQDTQVLIVEIGMRGLGEIELISRHLIADIAVITNSGSAHIGLLGSLDNIAIAKCEIISGLKPDGTFIALNQAIIKKHMNFGGERIFYSLEDVEIIEKTQSYSKFRYKNEIYKLNAQGDYNIVNSLAAIETGLKLNMTPDEIRQGLASYHTIEKRWELEKIQGCIFINDSYNANPESMKASVKTFVELYKNPLVILGNMGELGEKEVLYHKQVGEFLADCCKGKNVKFLTVGDLAKETGFELKNNGFEVLSFNNNEQASCYILDNLNKSYTIFLKASRSMKFEQILENVKRGICKL